MSDYSGIYEYKGFTIWNPSGDEWIAEPDWSIGALENLKEHLPEHKTIEKAKKWVREKGILLKEEDYL